MRLGRHTFLLLLYVAVLTGCDGTLCPAPSLTGEGEADYRGAIQDEHGQYGVDCWCDLDEPRATCILSRYGCERETYGVDLASEGAVRPFSTGEVAEVQAACEAVRGDQSAN